MLKVVVIPSQNEGFYNNRGNGKERKDSCYTLSK